MICFRAATRKHTMVGQKYFKGGGERHTFGGNSTKHNKINNNTENFSGGKIVTRGVAPLTPISCGPDLFAKLELASELPKLN